RDVSPQDAALQVVELRSGNQTEVHLPALAVIVQDSSRLGIAVRVNLACIVSEARVCRADLHADVVIVTDIGTGNGLPEEPPSLTPTGFLMPESHSVCAFRKID